MLKRPLPADGAHPPEPDHHTAELIAANLTPREHEVAALLARGCGYKEIAGHLAISANTVNNHLANIRAKLHARNSIEALNRLFGGYRESTGETKTGTANAFPDPTR